jgi:two-component system, LytTR family, response regulator
VTRIRTRIAAEPSVASRLRGLLQHEIEVAGDEENPQLVFLETRSESEAARRIADFLASRGDPAIVLLPGRNAHLVRLCERHDVAYLLEPLTLSSVRSALKAVREIPGDGAGGGRKSGLEPLLEDLKRQPAYAERLAVRSRGARSILKVEEIDWIEAAANYVRVHVAGEAHLLRRTMSDIETDLDPHRFARIHRCRIVNVDKITEYLPAPNGRYVVVLRDGTRLELSRGNRRKLPVFLGSAVSGR